MYISHVNLRQQRHQWLVVLQVPHGSVGLGQHDEIVVCAEGHQARAINPIPIFDVVLDGSDELAGEIVPQVRGLVVDEKRLVVGAQSAANVGDVAVGGADKLQQLGWQPRGVDAVLARGIAPSNEETIFKP